MKLISVLGVSAALSFATTATAAATTLRIGSLGASVAQLQAALHANQRGDFYRSAIDGGFGPLTRIGLTRWQRVASFATTGTITVGSRQWQQLRSEATISRLPGYIDRRSVAAARKGGWVVDASKSPAMVNVLHYDLNLGRVVVALSIAAAYGGNIGGVQYTTANGVFHIYAEFGAGFVSRLYNNAPMPYAACFNGGQCLHYDGLFPSHGCIHIPSWSAARYIDRLPIGTAVVVHE